MKYLLFDLGQYEVNKKMILHFFKALGMGFTYVVVYNGEKILKLFLKL